MNWSKRKKQNWYIIRLQQIT